MYKKFNLDNGTCIVYEKMPFAKTVSVGIWVRAGSMFETAEENGISHFIEHMLFKGTEKRSAARLAEEMDFVGGQMNAYTARECTCYYTKALPESLEISLDLLSDMYYNSLFRTDDIELERGVIIEEINMYEDSPEEVALDSLCEHMWGGSPLGYQVAGSAEIVSGLTREQMLSYMHRHYTPANTVISVAGSFDESELIRLCGKYFGKIGSSEIIPVPQAQMHGGRWQRKKEIEQAHLSIGYSAFTDGNDEIYAEGVLNEIFGGSMSGRLFQSVREKRGLCYSIYSYTAKFPTVGMLGVYAGLKPDSLPEAERVISEEAEKLCTAEVSSYELEKTRAQLRCSIIMSQESVNSVMIGNGKAQLLRGSIRTDDEIIRRIESVTAQDVRQAARKIFESDKKAVFVLEPQII